MTHRLILCKRRLLCVHKTTIKPNIDSPPVLATNTWDYVDLELKRRNESKARFYWKQARSFYNASLTLPKESSPLTLYYCFLNATKALLESKKINYATHHGVTGYSEKNKTTLDNERIFLKKEGILPSLIKYLEYPIKENGSKKFSLMECFYNLPFIHRSFLLTYNSSKYPELFIPIFNPIIGMHLKERKVWFCAELDEYYSDAHVLNKLPTSFERDKGYSDRVVIRSKKRVKWGKTWTEKKNTFYAYNKKIRKHIFYIHGTPISWYIKRRKDNIEHYNEYPPLVLTFAAMHRLSELSRYTPDKLSKHFSGKQNWLLSEFLKSAPVQFMDEIASEITGLEFKVPKNAI